MHLHAHSLINFIDTLSREMRIVSVDSPHPYPWVTLTLDARTQLIHTKHRLSIGTSVQSIFYLSIDNTDITEINTHTPTCFRALQR